MGMSEAKADFAISALQTIRTRLLDLTSRNRLLNFRHGNNGMVRVIDELPDQLAEALLGGGTFSFIPVNEPTAKQLIEHGYIKLDDAGNEVQLKADPSAREWAKVLGFNPNFELDYIASSNTAKHNDKYIQTLLFPHELEGQLRRIRQKANLAIEETGANVLYIAMGFLQWYDSDNSESPRLAPLYLIPVNVERGKLDKETGVYRYTLEYSSEDIFPNLSLREKLANDFGLALPELDDGVLPEAYFQLIQEIIIKAKPRWSIKRFATLAMFDFGKLLMYLDLDPQRWPSGNKNILNHPILQRFFSSGEVDVNDSSGLGLCEEYFIDDLPDVHNTYPLIDDADSSQHSALVDAVNGRNLVIEGPPGSGKSQTITNMIAAAIAQGKKVLFVAEKMAALQVVQSRLSRAGLGDFCLELHSNKTQKKQIYQDLAARLARQNEFQSVADADLEIQQYEEKRKVLSNYANLINRTWKSTGLTIHDIFCKATYLRDEYPEVAIRELAPNGISGDSYTGQYARVVGDELSAYGDVYEQVRQQVGENSALSEHPWFGVSNVNIQLFEADSICRMLQQWNDALSELKHLSVPLQLVLGEHGFDTSFDQLQQLLDDLALLSNLTVDVTLPLRALNEQTVPELMNYLAQCQSLNQTYLAINQHCHADAIERQSVEAMRLAYGDLQSQVDVSRTMGELYQSHLQLQRWLSDIAALRQNIKILHQQDSAILDCIDDNLASLTELTGYLSSFTELDAFLVNRRNDLFDEDNIDACLNRLSKVIAQTNLLKPVLAETMVLTMLPSADALRAIQAELNSGGLFRWFSGTWRNARRQLIALGISTKPNVELLRTLLPKAIQYQELLEQLDKDKPLHQALQHEYQGVSTAVDELLQLRRWYIAVRAKFGIGFGKNVPLARSLFSLPNDVFKGIQNLASSTMLTQLSDIEVNKAQLAQALRLPKGSSELRFDTEVSQLQAFSDRLERQLKALQQRIKSDLTLSKIEIELKQAAQWLDDEAAFCENDLERRLFNVEERLDCRTPDAVTIDSYNNVIAIYHRLGQLSNLPLKAYLLDVAEVAACASIKASIESLQAPMQNHNQVMQRFVAETELKCDEWFMQVDDSIAQWINRNERALHQPRWLASWVDFVRTKRTLVAHGVERLLQKVETGEVKLAQLNDLYEYAVFDILSREVIAEKQALAHFTGTDHNAIQRQFKDYDNRLKHIQQRKIASQVAELGLAQLRQGVTGGKVADLTEMGLIRNEVNKKTKHVPIRQLIRRAGHSLLALKPCFMMGPNAVAQYLAAGELEFDLVIMDEASQIRPQDALGAIARASQLVVVGDPKQLPPTSFFDKAIDDDNPDATAIEQSESILDVSLPIFTARRLRWHYRSRHESLIEFSNREFYDSNLIIFPSPAKNSHEFGLKFNYVERGRFVNQHNIEEAMVISRAVRQHMLHHGHESLGVVAMSSSQRDQIERCIEELSKEDDLFREQLTQNAQLDEPLFVKNLENVQGDERDVIFISCTYGPLEAGSSTMPQRFGPINSASGERRLNVLFTRAKKRMQVFSSMKEGHIRASDNSNPGVHALKRFLGFAESGQIHQPHINGQAESNYFEGAVKKALRREGFESISQVGVAGYFIDLAVLDPNNPECFILGIECDGASYHSAKSARDRDRLRQSVLEGLGWEIQRIWSTDWFKNPQAQLKPIIEKLRHIQTQSSAMTDASSDFGFQESMIGTESWTSTEQIRQSAGSLVEKLERFAEFIRQDEPQVVEHRSLLRPAMIAALAKVRPISKAEYVEYLPSYLRLATDTAHDKYLEPILNLIAEAEMESTAQGMLVQ